MKHSETPEHCDYCEEPVYSRYPGRSGAMFLCREHYRLMVEEGNMPAPTPRTPTPPLPPT